MGGKWEMRRQGRGKRRGNDGIGEKGGRGRKREGRGRVSPSE